MQCFNSSFGVERVKVLSEFVYRPCSASKVCETLPLWLPTKQYSGGNSALAKPDSHLSVNHILSWKRYCMAIHQFNTILAPSNYKAIPSARAIFKPKGWSDPASCRATVCLVQAAQAFFLIRPFHRFLEFATVEVVIRPLHSRPPLLDQIPQIYY